MGVKSPLKKSFALEAAILPRLCVVKSSTNLLIRLRFDASILDKIAASIR
ncbi:MAG: hypothetical protein ABIK28_20935 [Planctomycetota bacterium]